MSITNNLNNSLAQRAAFEAQDFDSEAIAGSSIWEIKGIVIWSVLDLTSCLEYLKGPVNKDALVIKTRYPGENAAEDYKVCAALINSGRFDINKKLEETGHALKNACFNLNKPLVELFLSHGGVAPHRASGCLISILKTRADSPEKMGDKYAIAQLLWEKLSVDQIKSRYEKDGKFLGLFGISGDTFLKELEYEMTRVLTAKSGEPFDKAFLKRMSGVYQNFWTELSVHGEPIDRSRFEAALVNFPYKTAAINFLPLMFEVHLAMQEVEKLKGFPLSELWRFAIDAHKQEIGCCAFEDEPLYLKGFFLGMLFAIQTRDQPKTAAWYVELHKRLVDGIFTPQGNFMTTSESILSTSFRPINVDIRTGGVCYNVEKEDQDPLGIEDLKTRSGASSYTFYPSCQKVDYEDGKGDETARRNDLVFESFNNLLPTMTNRAQKLLLFLWTARELELEHIFYDANGRGSHLIFLSLVLGEDDLPPFLFPQLQRSRCKRPRIAHLPLPRRVRQFPAWGRGPCVRENTVR